MGIGSFLWYWLERTAASGGEAAAPGARPKAKGRDFGRSTRPAASPSRARSSAARCGWPSSTRSPQRHTRRPIKACVGAGPCSCRRSRTFAAGPVKNRYDLSHALADVFRAEIDDLVDAGCKHVQLEDLGAWMPTLSRSTRTSTGCSDDRRPHDGGRRGRRTLLALLPGQRVGQHARGHDRRRLRARSCRTTTTSRSTRSCSTSRAARWRTPTCSRELPADKKVHAGVIDVRTLEIEPPEQVAERIRKVLEHIEPPSA